MDVPVIGAVVEDQVVSGEIPPPPTVDDDGPPDCIP
jgi:hypothetical protein